MVKIHAPDGRLIEEVCSAFNRAALEGASVAREHPTLGFDFKYSSISWNSPPCGEGGAAKIAIFPHCRAVQKKQRQQNIDKSRHTVRSFSSPS